MIKERYNLFMAIHSHLHAGVNNIKIENQDIPIQTNNRSQTACIKYGSKVFLRQGPTNTVYGRMVKAGHEVTCIIRVGKKWGYIIYQDIHDPLDGE